MNHPKKPSGFFATLGEKISRFMYGRYGVDPLFAALIVLVLIVLSINLFVPGLVASLILFAVELGLMGYAIFREFSRNIPARRRENEAFMRVWRKVTGCVRLTWRRIRERKTHIYRKCPSCGATLRLARRAGEHTVRCPKCADRFDIKVK